MAGPLFDHLGRPVVLAKELGRGGEGAVFEIAGNKDYVAKTYFNPVSTEKAEKLALMVRIADETIRKFAAWPIASLHRQPQGPVTGVVMPKIHNPTEIHELYSPAHRKVVFPSADWRFLIRTASNCAAAFQSLHNKNVVIGDVNQGNILVSKRGTVNLIDCDSFQITGNGKTYKCRVGVAHFTPPELPNFETLRTFNHDNFGLAVLIFHLLFMGRHPYSGRFLGQGEMPLEKAIKENRFAFSRLMTNHQMSPPPNSLKMEEVGEETANLFERAFSPPSSGKLRPTAAQWVQALVKLEASLDKCSNDPGHYYVRNGACPWCRIEKEGGPNFYISISFKAAAAKSTTFNIHKVWYEINLVKSPEHSFRPAVRASMQLKPRPVPDDLDPYGIARKLLAGIALTGSALNLLIILFPIIALLSLPMTFIFSIWWFLLWRQKPINREVDARAAVVDRCRAELQQAKNNMSTVAQRHLAIFNSARKQLTEAKNLYDGLDKQRQAEYNHLQSHAAEQQLRDFLEKRFISAAKIPGVGPVRIVTLESYGIETAADVTYDQVLAVPGFGHSLASNLVAWRKSQEAAFRFDPSRGAPASAIQALHNKYLQIKMRLENQLEGGAEQLRKIVSVANAEVGKLDEQVAKYELALAQAEVDLNAIRR